MGPPLGPPEALESPPGWWIAGVAIYVPLFLVATVARVRAGEEDPWRAIWASALFLGVSTASALFWFG
jgi:hypothetical protein